MDSPYPQGRQTLRKPALSWPPAPLDKPHTFVVITPNKYQVKRVQASSRIREVSIVIIKTRRSFKFVFPLR